MIAATAHTILHQRLARVWFFFPIQLLVLHAKKNHFLLVFWVIAFGFSTGFLGSRYGVDHLFLLPEYRGATGPMAFFLLGFTIGGFILAFNLYSYILHGFRFPFIATLNRPFLKFTYNNFLLPGLFILVYLVMSFRFQIDQELLSVGDTCLNLGGLLFGIVLFTALTLFYFASTNKSAHNIHKSETAKDEENLVSATLHRPGKWYPSSRRSRNWRVETYLSSPWSVKLARDSVHYDAAILEKVFAQNHINASILEIGLIITFVVIGSFSQNEFFVIPAAASVFIFFSILLMLVSALFSWVKGWTVALLLGLVLLANFTYNDNKLFNIDNQAYGLDYSEEPATYSTTYIHGQNDADSLAQADHAHGIQMLENWKRKQSEDLPPLVVLQCSGGGTRAALWTYAALAQMDSLSGGEMMDHTFMITGSSGGMYGAAYFRELKLRQLEDASVRPTAPEHCEAIGGDLLNPVLFSMATNDYFFRYRSYHYDNKEYTLDRAAVFEERMHANTGSLMEKTLGDYAQAEANAQIPWMIFTPSITRDGRRLLVSSQPASYFTQNRARGIQGSDAVPEYVEYRRLFANHQPDSIRFSSVIRMNATFPYIMPTVSLPSEPAIEVMDAGMRDNFGMKTAVHFLYNYKDWIEENTSEVIIVQIRDLQKDFNTQDSEPSLFGQMTAPVGTVYGNFTRMQDFAHDEQLLYLQEWLELPTHLITFSLHQLPEEKISLSWHLTAAEKRRIEGAIHSADFTEPFARFQEVLEPELVQLQGIPSN